jgi:7-cyano-7-deazaguanine tRNA-ribosyltransferase
MFGFFVALGCDLFDSAAYALYARSNRYLTTEGTVELSDMEEFPCSCSACCGRTPSEVRELDLPERVDLLSTHNLQTCFSELRGVREAIRRGRLWDLLEARAHTHPALKRCLNRIASYSADLERSTPVVKPHGIFYFGPVTNNRPELQGYKTRLAKVPIGAGSTLLLLPGRWRRPYRADPRYRPLISQFEDEQSVQIVFYTLPFGPVPSELDETYPVAQTEGLDAEDLNEHRAKAEMVMDYVKRLKPKVTVLVVEGDYGKAVLAVARKTLRKARVKVVDGGKTEIGTVTKMFGRLIAD